MTLSPYDQTRLRNWRFAHLLAALDALFIVIALSVNFTDPVEHPSLPDLVALPVVIGIFWFLGWMIYDLYENGVESNKAAWWLIVVLLNVFGALMYFFSVWRPRNRPFND